MPSTPPMVGPKRGSETGHKAYLPYCSMPGALPSINSRFLSRFRRSSNHSLRLRALSLLPSLSQSSRVALLDTGTQSNQAHWRITFGFPTLIRRPTRRHVSSQMQHFVPVNFARCHTTVCRSAAKPEVVNFLLVAFVVTFSTTSPLC